MRILKIQKGYVSAVGPATAEGGDKQSQLFHAAPRDKFFSHKSLMPEFDIQSTS